MVNGTWFLSLAWSHRMYSSDRRFPVLSSEIYCWSYCPLLKCLCWGIAAQPLVRFLLRRVSSRGWIETPLAVWSTGLGFYPWCLCWGTGVKCLVLPVPHLKSLCWTITAHKLWWSVPIQKVWFIGKASPGHLPSSWKRTGGNLFQEKQFFFQKSPTLAIQSKAEEELNALPFSITCR